MNRENMFALGPNVSQHASSPYRNWAILLYLSGQQSRPEVSKLLRFINMRCVRATGCEALTSTRLKKWPRKAPDRAVTDAKLISLRIRSITLGPVPSFATPGRGSSVKVAQKNRRPDCKQSGGHVCPGGRTDSGKMFTQWTVDSFIANRNR